MGIQGNLKKSDKRYTEALKRKKALDFSKAFRALVGGIIEQLIPLIMLFDKIEYKHEKADF